MNRSESTTRCVVNAVVAACLFAVPYDSNASHGDDPPNIVLLMGDDHAWDETGYNGHPHLKTPELDQIAATGLRMNRFYSAHPTCSPTRGSVMTGRHPNRYGTFTPNCSIRPEEISIAHILAEAGYACGHFGKWHLGPVKADSPTSPGAMGFHQWLSHDNFFEVDPILSRNGETPEQITGEGSAVIVEEAMRFIDEAVRREQPFVAVVWFGSPHEPYVGMEEDLALYDDVPDLYSDRSVRLTSVETGLPTTRPLGDVLRERYAEITAMDRAIGMLRQHLDSAGVRQNTLLWYCGDNGIPSSGRATTPFRGQKGNMYEGGIRVPGAIEWPGRITKPRATNVNAVTSDILPTICDLVGLPLPERPLDGISLKFLIGGKMANRPSPICFWSFPSSRDSQRVRQPYINPRLQEGTTPLIKKLGGRFTRNFNNLHHPNITGEDFGGVRVILDNRYKLILTGHSADETTIELFDISSDPAEQTNIADSHPEVAEELSRKLVEWQESVLNSLTGEDY